MLLDNLDPYHAWSWQVYLNFLTNVIFRIMLFIDFFRVLGCYFFACVTEFKVSRWFSLEVRNQRFAFQAIDSAVVLAGL